MLHCDKLYEAVLRMGFESDEFWANVKRVECDGGGVAGAITFDKQVRIHSSVQEQINNDIKRATAQKQ